MSNMGIRQICAIFASTRWFIALVAGVIAATAAYILFSPDTIAFASFLLLSLLFPLAFYYPRQAFLLLLMARSVVDIAGDIPIISLSFLPLISLRGISLNLSATLGILLIGWGLWYFMKYWPLPRFKGKMALMIFFIVGTISVMTSMDIMESGQEFIKFINLIWVFIIAFDIVKDWRGYWTLISALAAAIVVPLIVASAQLISGEGLSYEISNRLIGTFGHPNTFAFALIMAFSAWLIMGEMWKYKRSSCPSWLCSLRTKATFRIVYTVLLCFLLLTYTRGAWIGLSILLLVFGFRFTWRKTTAVLVSIALTVSLFPLFNSALYSYTGFDLTDSQLVRRFSTDEEDMTSWAWRVRSWKEISVKLHSLPWFGYGVGMYPKVREETISYITDLKSREAHNDYMRLTIEIGYLGVISYSLFFILMASEFLHRSVTSQDETEKRVFTIAGATVAAFIIMSIADNILRATAVNWLLWALMGGTLGLSYHLRPHAPAFPSQRSVMNPVRNNKKRLLTGMKYYERHKTNF